MFTFKLPTLSRNSYCNFKFQKLYQSQCFGTLLLYNGCIQLGFTFLNQIILMTDFCIFNKVISEKTILMQVYPFLCIFTFTIMATSNFCTKLETCTRTSKLTFPTSFFFFLSPLMGPPIKQLRLFRCLLAWIALLQPLPAHHESVVSAEPVRTAPQISQNPTQWIINGAKISSRIEDLGGSMRAAFRTEWPMTSP